MSGILSTNTSEWEHNSEKGGGGGGGIAKEKMYLFFSLTRLVSILRPNLHPFVIPFGTQCLTALQFGK